MKHTYSNGFGRNRYFYGITRGGSFVYDFTGAYTCVSDEAHAFTVDQTTVNFGRIRVERTWSNPLNFTAVVVCTATESDDYVNEEYVVFGCEPDLDTLWRHIAIHSPGLTRPNKAHKSCEVSA